MSESLSNQTMALAGVFQAAALVNQLATSGAVDRDHLNTAVDTILNLNPSSVTDVLNGTQSIQVGLSTLKNALAKNGRGVEREILHYAMAIIAVQSKLAKREDLMTELGKQLDRAVDQKAYFNDALHESVLAATARCYQSSISQLSFRIRVTGNPRFLQDSKVAEQVRTLLLYGVRCAMLWRHCGGRRWHFMLNRQKMQQQANALLNVA